MYPFTELNAIERERRKKLFQRVEIKILVTLPVLVLFYGIYARSLDAWTYAVPRMALAIFAVVACVFLYDFFFKGGDENLSALDLLIFMLVFVIVAMVAAAIYYCFAVLAIDSYHVISKSSPVAIGVATAVVGCLLFEFRRRARALYGLTEAIAGITVAMQRSPSGDVTVLPWDSGFFLAILTAGVYLVVRGLDNIQIGISKDPIDPIASKLITGISVWLRRQPVETHIARKKLNRARGKNNNS